MSTNIPRPSIVPAVYYQDPNGAIDWLETAFGFEKQMVITGDKGEVQHAEMRSGNGYVMVGGEWADWAKSPKSVGGANTQDIEVQLDAGIDAHCERARAAGAIVAQEPEDQFYGHRIYRAVDPEGHRWTFSQTIRQVTREEAEQTSGLKIDGWA
ncbi:MAG: VOC family protein [Dehalococcoidia bacterium]